MMWYLQTKAESEIINNTGPCFSPIDDERLAIPYNSNHFVWPSDVAFPNIRCFYPGSTVYTTPDERYMFGYFEPTFDTDEEYNIYGKNRLIRIKDLAFAAYKKVKIVIANKRASGPLKVDSFKICLFDASGNVVPNSTLTLRSSTVSISNGSTSTYYANIPIVPDWYNATYYMGIYIGEFAAKRKIYIGVDNLASSYVADAKSGSFKSNVLYSKFISDHSTLYVACGDDASGYKSSAYGQFFRQFENNAGADSGLYPIDSSPTLACPTT